MLTIQMLKYLIQLCQNEHISPDKLFHFKLQTVQFIHIMLNDTPVHGFFIDFLFMVVHSFLFDISIELKRF